MNRWSALYITLLVICLVQSSTTYGLEEYELRFEHLNVEGLPHASVFSILQDTEGFLWFGTEDGLSKFDGYTFHVYHHDPQDPYSIGNNWVRTLYQDQQEYIWIGTEQGLSRFDRQTGRFTNYVVSAMPTAQPRNAVLSISEDHTGKLWLGTGNGEIFVFDKASQQVVSLYQVPTNPYSKNLNDIQTLLFDTLYGVLWVGSQAGLHKFDPATQTFTTYVPFPEALSQVPLNHVISLYEDRSSDLWVGTAQGGLLRFNRITETFTAVYRHNSDKAGSIGGDAIWAITKDLSGTLWVGTGDGGISVYHEATDSFSVYSAHAKIPYSLSSHDIRVVYPDRSGILWIGTHNLGIDVFDANLHRFRHYANRPDDPHSLSPNPVRAIEEDSAGNLWIGTEGSGLNTFDRQRGEFVHYTHRPENPHSLSDNFVTAIKEDPAGMIWVATWNGGLNRFDPITKTFTRYKHDPRDPGSIDSGNIQALLIDHTGTLWVGGRTLSRYEPETDTFFHYGHNQLDPKNPKSMSGNHIQTNALVEDADGFLWLGLWGGGLNKFDPRTETFVHYVHEPQNQSSLSDDRVISLCADREGIIWVGTPGSGLNKLNPKTGTIVRYSTNDGLPNDFLYGIVEDNQGDLWISTNKGLSRFNQNSGTFRNYNAKDGLQHDQFFWGASFKTRRGELVFGGINGFNLFEPTSLSANAFVPPVVLTSLKQGGEPLPLDQMPEKTREIILDWRHNFFEFEYAALNYTKPEKNQYAYMLEGLDDDWYYSGTHRIGRYAKLPDGSFTLRIRGSNNDGVWNKQGVTMRVTVVPPFWRTWWFRGCVTLVLAGGLMGGVALRLLTVEARQRQLEGLVEKRTEEVRQANNEINSLNERLKVENRRVSADLRESERTYRTLVEEMADGYIVLEKGTIAFANPAFCEMHGYQINDVLGKPFSQFVDPEDFAKIAEIYHKSHQETSDSYLFEYLRLTQDGRSLFTEITVKTAHYENRLVDISICRDITERVDMEQRMREAERLAYIGRITASLSHEIRNPLSAVKMNLQILKKRQLLQDNNARRVDISIQEVMRLEGILNELLDFAKPLSLRKQSCQLNTILSSCIELLQVKFDQKKVIAQSELDDTLPELVADREKLSQAFMNLLLNACEASDEQGHIVIDSRLHSYDGQPGLEVCIHDEGVGLPEKQVEEMFKPFFTTKEKGTGLGLTNVKNIIEAHNGSIRAENRDPCGAIFRVWLPIGS